MTLPFRRLELARFLLSDIVFFHDPLTARRPRWWLAASLIAVVCAGVGALAQLGRLGPPALTAGEKHRNWSIEIAVNRVFCGAPSRLSTSVELAERLENRSELLDIPLRDVIRDAAGSLPAYCRTVNEPFLNGENSLMLQMASFLSLERDLSLRDVGWRLQAVRIVALAFVAYVLLSNGASLLFTGIVLCSGLAIVGQMTTKFYSVYPFAPVLLLLAAALLSLAVQHARALGGPGVVVTALLFGWLTAFSVNMRSSHLPVYLAFAVIYLLVASRAAAGRTAVPRASTGVPLRWTVLGALAFGAAYGLFGWLLIRPLTIEPPHAGQASTHHVVAHPLVLALAVPENALSRAEGISWDDRVGLTLARRVDPQVSYLHRGYESALFLYYRQLWQRHPREMLGIYFNKLRVAGADMISRVRASPGGRVARFALWPLGWIQGGPTLLLVYAGLFACSLALHLRRGSPFAFTLALVTLAGAGLHLEATLIYSLFDMTHNASQLLCYLFLAALAWQLVLEVSRLVFRAGLRRLRREQVPLALGRPGPPGEKQAW